MREVLCILTFMPSIVKCSCTLKCCDTQCFTCLQFLQFFSRTPPSDNNTSVNSMSTFHERSRRTNTSLSMAPRRCHSFYKLPLQWLATSGCSWSLWSPKKECVWCNVNYLDVKTNTPLVPAIRSSQTDRPYAGLIYQSFDNSSRHPRNK